MEVLTDASNRDDVLTQWNGDTNLNKLSEGALLTKLQSKRLIGSDSESETENKSPIKKCVSAVMRRKVVISDDDESETERNVCDEEAGSDLDSEERKPKLDKTEKKFLSSDDGSDDEAVKRGRLLKDADLFDDEMSGDDSKTGENNSHHGSENSANSSSDDGIERQMSNKYRKPASKQAQKSRPSRRAKSAADETIKIYSEKQRLIREQGVNIKTYEPPKLSLVEFLRERDPSLAERVTRTNKSGHKKYAEKTSKKIGLVESMKLREQELREKFLRENSSSVNSSQELSQDIMNIELSTNQTPSTNVSQPIETQDLSSQPENIEPRLQGSNSAAESSLPMDLYDTQRSEDYTQSQTDMDSDVKTEIERVNTEEGLEGSSSSIMVLKKTDEQMKRREAKKAKLKALLGDSVDLESAPKALQPDENGMINLDSTLSRTNNQSLKKYNDVPSNQNAALSVVKVREDGSQEELSMFNYVNKTAEQLGGKTKLTILKEILQLKIEQKRIDELKQKEETLRIEMMEEDLEGEDADDESESDVESEHDEITPVSIIVRDEITPVSNIERDEDDDKESKEEEESNSETELKYMKRAKAVVDSDNEEDLPLQTAVSKSLFSDSQSVTTNSVSQSSPSVCDSQPIRNKDSQSLNPFDTKSIRDLTEGKMLINTQQADDELGGLLSGAFNTQPLLTTQTADKTDTVDGARAESDDEDVETETCATVKLKQKAAALNFSDEESETEIAQREIEIETTPRELETETAQRESEDENSDRESNVQSDNNEDEGDHSELVAEDEIRLQKLKKSRKRELMSEWMDEEAELSGSDVGDDDIEPESDEEELKKLCDGDNDDVGTETQIKKVIGRLAMKQQKDRDDRELMLYKERFLTDGELHSNTIRKRKFKWSNFTYRDDMTSRDDNEDVIEEETEEDRQREERRKEFENFCRQKRQEDREKMEVDMEKTVRELDNSQTDSKPQPISTNVTNSTCLPATKKRKKSRVLAGFSRDRMEDLKSIYKDFKVAEGRTVNAQSRKFTFQTLSREAAANQNDQIFNKA